MAGTKTTLLEAQTSAENRRGRATTASPTSGHAAEMENLAKYIHFQHGVSSEGSTAAGIKVWADGAIELYVGGTWNVPQTVNQTIQRWYEARQQNNINWAITNANKFVIDRLGDISGFHAEMIVVRARLIHFNMDLAGLTDFHVGASRFVCDDCSGWMTKHGVCHAPIGADQYGTKSWRNPRSGASYGFEQGKVSYYLFPGKESLGKV